LDYDKLLNGRSALITVGGQAPALEIAELFREHGADVAMVGGGDFNKKLPKADILVNAAGCWDVRPMSEVAPDEFNAMLASSLYSTARFIKAVMPGMLALRRGNIINLAPDLSEGSAVGSAVAACAGAVYSFTRSVTADYIRYNVRANCVPFHFTIEGGKTPLLGLPDGSDTAHMALWYACGMSRFVVGETVPVNGGMNYCGNIPAAGGELK